MSKFARFMKANKVKKENVKFAVTKSLLDENGKPLEWEFRHIPTKEDRELRDECTREVPITGRFGAYREKFNSSEYVTKLVVASTVVPDLMDAELQDSYGVKTPEDLLMQLVDSSGEYAELTRFVQELQGFEALQKKVDEAKN